MPQPSKSDVHVNRPLENISVAFMQDAGAFMGSNVFPRVRVTKASDQFFTYDRSFWFRSDAQRRAPGTESAGGGYGISTDSFATERWAIHKDIPDPIRANADAPIDMDAEAARYVGLQLLIRQEVDWAARYFTTSVWTGSSSGGDITPATLWDDAASDPVRDIKTQARSILQNTAQRPNTLVLGAKVFDDLTQHPDIIDRIKYTAGAGNPAIVSEQTLAALFGVGRVLVPRGVQNTAAEGATASFSFVVGTRNALLCYSAPNPGLMTPSAGYTFVWPENGSGNEFGITVKMFRLEEKLESDRVEGEVYYDQKVVSASLGAFFSNTVAA